MCSHTTTELTKLAAEQLDDLSFLLRVMNRMRVDDANHANRLTLISIAVHLHSTASQNLFELLKRFLEEVDSDKAAKELGPSAVPVVSSVISGAYPPVPYEFSSSTPTASGGTTPLGRGEPCSHNPPISVSIGSTSTVASLSKLVGSLRARVKDIEKRTDAGDDGMDIGTFPSP